MLLLSFFACAEDPTEPAPEPTEPAARLCPDGSPAAELGEGEGSGLYAVVGDFSLPLRDGATYTWSERFTGCETLLFVPSRPVQEDGNPVPLLQVSQAPMPA